MLACGLVGARFESRFGGCREVAETYFAFFCSEILSCGMDKPTLTLKKIGTVLKDNISFLMYQNLIELRIVVQWNFQSLSNLLYHVPTVSLLLFLVENQQVR
jgi:hypothetical protein